MPNKEELFGCRTIPKSHLGSVIDLFCGAGGLAHGFFLEGYKVKAGIDADPACKYPFEANNFAPFYHWNIEGLTGKMLTPLFDKDKPKILIGCAPCQPFSSYNNNNSNNKWLLLKEFSRIIEEVSPEIISMENVPRLLNFQDGKLFSDFVHFLENLGYFVFWKVVNCESFGVPQSRKRLVLLASNFGEISLIHPTHDKHSFVTVADTISHLPPLKAGEESDEDPLHKCSRLSPQNLSRIKASKPGGSWKDWNKKLISDCHKKESGQSYPSVYGRMEWDKPSPTITTQCNGFGNGRFGHPVQDRAISLREAALLQTFPSDYKFFHPHSNWHISTVARLIGNAVPVELSRAIAISIETALGDKCEF